MSILIDLKNITKKYNFAQHQHAVLSNINLQIMSGELIAITGVSGSGKSTLMNIIGLLDQPDEGQYFLNHQPLIHLSEDKLATIRNQTIGFVFQSFYLLPKLTVLENVALPLFYRGIQTSKRLISAYRILCYMDISQYANHRPNVLSGGQQQRVAIARALVGSPSIILADEPTGALDSSTGKEIIALFMHLNQKQNVTIIIVTHDRKIAAQCPRIIHLSDGVIVSDKYA